MKIKKRELEYLINEAVNRAGLKEGWLDRLKSKGKSALKGKNDKGVSRAETMVNIQKKKLLSFLMDLEQLGLGSGPVAKDLKSIESQVQSLISHLDIASEKFGKLKGSEPEVVKSTEPEVAKEPEVVKPGEHPDDKLPPSQQARQLARWKAASKARAKARKKLRQGLRPKAKEKDVDFNDVLPSKGEKAPADPARRRRRKSRRKHPTYHSNVTNVTEDK